MCKYLPIKQLVPQLTNLMRLIWVPVSMRIELYPFIPLYYTTPLGLGKTIMDGIWKPPQHRLHPVTGTDAADHIIRPLIIVIEHCLTNDADFGRICQT